MGINCSVAESSVEKLEQGANEVPFPPEKGEVCDACKVREQGCGRYYPFRRLHCKEKLCAECELQRFPDRFWGCIFCRQPIRKDICGSKWPVCKVCADGFQSWVVQHAQPPLTEPWSSRAVHKLLLSNTGRFCRNSFVDRGFVLSSWPGFYLGEEHWIRPDILLQRKAGGSSSDQKEASLSELNCCEVLEEILSMYGLYPFRETQCDLRQTLLHMRSFTVHHISDLLQQDEQKSIQQE